MATSGTAPRPFPVLPPICSSSTRLIAGILVTIYGLTEVVASFTGQDDDPIASPKPALHCLWLLHPRGADQSRMKLLARSVVHSCHEARQSSSDSSANYLIAISFDQRNHGTRFVDARANEDWQSGNPTHAQDLFSIYNGTMLDLSQLITLLPASLGNEKIPDITQHIACGISLGGHCVWQSLFHETRISAGISVVGSPDFAALMRYRSSNTTTTHDHHASLQRLDPMIRQYDPAGILSTAASSKHIVRSLDDMASKSFESTWNSLSDTQHTLATKAIQSILRGKRILDLSGEDDSLVPHDTYAPFISTLQSLQDPTDIASFKLNSVCYPGVGHALSHGMVQEINRFVIRCVFCSPNERIGTPVL